MALSSLTKAQLLQRVQELEAAQVSSRTERFSKASARLEELTCPICVTPKLTICSLPCQHLCCVEDANKLCRSKQPCSICRKPIPKGTEALLAVNPNIRDEI